MNTSLEALVKKYFGFLESDYAMQMTKISRNIIRWTNNDVFFDVNYDSTRSCELNARLGRVGLLVNGTEVVFGLDEIARLSGNEWGNRAFSATNESELEKELLRMADVLKKTGRDFLANSSSAFETVEVQRRHECRVYAKEKELAVMRVDAEKAWRNKDFIWLVQLYQDHVDSLTALEKKRFAYALSH